MGEINEPEDSVNHCVAERDQGIDRADRQTIYDLLKKKSQVSPGLGLLFGINGFKEIEFSILDCNNAG
ncbi:MAG: hypothetical protein ACTHMT_14900, partial [Verrucomicrobiota bacterium]